MNYLWCFVNDGGRSLVEASAGVPAVFSCVNHPFLQVSQAAEGSADLRRAGAALQKPDKLQFCMSHDVAGFLCI